MRQSILLFAVISVALAGNLLSKPVNANEQVQLHLFLVKAYEVRRKRPGNVAIVVYMEAKSNRESAYLCQTAPRYRSAVIGYLSTKTYRLDKKGKLDLKALHGELKPIIKKVDKRNFVLKMEIKQGLPKVDMSSARRLNRFGCIQIFQEPKEEIKAEDDKKGDKTGDKKDEKKGGGGH